MSSNKPIASNAIMLYIRMFITMIVGLYTSRIILNVLGVEDYGIYNVVGGFVAMFSLISSSLSGAISRFLTYEIGNGNIEKLKSVFSTSLLVQIIFSIFIILLAETFGLWYLSNKIVMPDERFMAAYWVFQFSLISFTLNLLIVPYNAAIVAHEEMGIYAYISIYEATCKLLICYLISLSFIDKLVTYAILLCGVTVSVQCINMIYCSMHFDECKLKITFNGSILKEMFGFAGWNFIGSSASILRTQGVSLLFNAFGGPIVNAANGISTTICGVVTNFVGNFTTAFSPQITKRYAAKAYQSMLRLIHFSAKFSFFLIFIIAFPVILNLPFIMQIWLGSYPDHTIFFVRLTLVYLLIDSVSRPLIVAKNATGNIRNYQIVVGGLLLMQLPIAYASLKFGAPVESVMVANIFTALAALLARMYMLNGNFPGWSSKRFLLDVFCRLIVTAFFASLFPYLVSRVLGQGWKALFLTTSLSILCTAIVVYMIGLTKEEKVFVMQKILQVRKRYSNE